MRNGNIIYVDLTYLPLEYLGTYQWSFTDSIPGAFISPFLEFFLIVGFGALAMEVPDEKYTLESRPAWVHQLHKQFLSDRNVISNNEKVFGTLVR